VKAVVKRCESGTIIYPLRDGSQDEQEPHSGLIRGLRLAAFARKLRIALRGSQDGMKDRARARSK
jgi:hypothetical protein